MAGQPFERNPVEARIAIPSDIAASAANDPARAREIQQTASEQFRAAFDRGLAVIGLRKPSKPALTY